MIDTPSLIENRRCFVSGNQSHAIERLTDMIRLRGVDAVSSNDVGSGVVITNEILRLMSKADYVAVVISEESHRNSYQNALFELGLAQGLEKPCFVVFSGTLGINLPSVYMVAVEDVANLDPVASDLDRFLRKAHRYPKSELAPAWPDPKNLEWARNELSAQREFKRSDRPHAFERLCEKLFRFTGAQVEDVGAKDLGADLIVWLDDVAFEMGGPALVECKIYGGGAGGVAKVHAGTVPRIEAAIEGSEAKLGLLIYDLDDPSSVPYLYDTPIVQPFAILDLIDAMERGDLQRIILQRREDTLFRGRGK
ncbi:restriction endonuclease [Agrobacterium sp. CNPSo 3708]|uniref:restriction endonuclease n=1 Tax=Agrobacterium sp. CNPSo 3708 TaxID=3028150 RepID=UPI002363E397|nr:restriction endonuclease [Agrobacterium sp. CNPSo 3708]MDD1498790.1 restriction endonuclease [Agrobacterium sp. CNPSo 3708]